jgi:hypothetical protein
LAAVHNYLGQPWVPTKPNLFEQVGNIVSPFVWHFDDLKPSGSGIDHCHSMQYAEHVGNSFSILILLDLAN